MAIYKTGKRKYVKKEMTFTSDSVWTVPYGVKSISVDCVGSQGFSNSQASGGKGGRVRCTLTTKAGQTLYIVTGKRSGSEASAVYNASDIRTVSGDLSSRIVVAGGGGNCSLNTRDSTYSTGGAGGGLTGGAATNVTRTRGGAGGTQTAGGAGGTRIDTGAGANGNAGSLGLGGAGYSGTTSGGGTGSSGAGGAGYYGGGSGAWYEYYGWNCAGGGGGSSYTNGTLCSEVVHTQGYREGVGYVKISFETDEYMDVDKAKDIYFGALKKRIVAVYKGSKLVYNLKYNLNTSSAYTKIGTISGTNKFGTDNGQTSTTSLNQTSTFTFNTPAPSGKWTGKFIYYSQVNFSMSQVYWQLTYEDGTKEYAYGPKSLGDTANGGGETATISLSFTATKPIKTVTVYAKGAGSGNGCYGGLGSIQMSFDGSTQ